MVEDMQGAQVADRRYARRADRVRSLLISWRALAFLAAGLMAATTGWLAIGQPEPDDTSAVLTHVHGLGVNPADGQLYIATHDGLLAQGPDGIPRRVGDGRQDTMGFVVAGPDHFIASGHPAEVGDDLPHLGLQESRDAGQTWRLRGFAGAADFHVLRAVPGVIYGYDTVTEALIAVHDDGTSETRWPEPLRDFVVSPSNGSSLIGAGPDGLQRSSDGGRTWTQVNGPDLSLLAWSRQDQLWGVGAGGDVYRSSDGGGVWTRTGNVGGRPTAFTAVGGSLYAAVEGGGVMGSADDGRTWDRK